jgi:hypothetical protein
MSRHLVGSFRSIIGVPLFAIDVHVAQTWIEAEFHDHWTLSADELTLLHGMTDQGGGGTL